MNGSAVANTPADRRQPIQRAGDELRRKRQEETQGPWGGTGRSRSVCGDGGQYVREEVIPVRVSVLTAV